MQYIGHDHWVKCGHSIKPLFHSFKVNWNEYPVSSSCSFLLSIIFLRLRGWVLLECPIFLLIFFKNKIYGNMNHKHHKPSMKSETRPFKFMNQRSSLEKPLRKPEVQVANLSWDLQFADIQASWHDRWGEISREAGTKDLHLIASVNICIFLQEKMLHQSYVSFLMNVRL